MRDKSGYSLIKGDIKRSSEKLDSKATVESSLSMNSIAALLSLCSASSLASLGGILFINIIASVIPLIFFIQTSKSFQKMAENLEDRGNYFSEIKSISILMFLCGGVYIIIATLGSYLMFAFSRIQGSVWRSFYFDTLLNKDAGFFDLNPEAASGTNINIECRHIEEAFGDDLILFIGGLSLSLGLFVLAASCSLELTLVCLIIFPAQYIGFVISNLRSTKAGEKVLQMYSMAGLKSQETIENIKTVSALNCQQIRIQQYSEELKPLKDSCIKDGINNGVAWGIIYSVTFAVNGVMFYVSTLYIEGDKETWVQGKIEIADMIIVYYCYFMGSILIGMAYTSLKRIIRGMSTAKKILDIAKNSQERIGVKKIEQERWTIEFDQVKFRYPSKPSVKVLRNISFKMEPGEKIAFVGSTGSGKSTIPQLLLGFYKCSSGLIKLNETSIEALDIKHLRKWISYVNQEPLLYSTSIKKNIKLGKKDCTEQDILDALNCAEATEFIENMPMKIDSYVGNRGSQLSGGEKQRIALARAFLRKPRLLILDEATSALDAITESKILQNMTERYPSTSMIVIAHRLKTVKNVNSIYCIQQGKIIESGSFNELITNQGYFFNLLERLPQMRSEEENLILDSSTNLKNTEENQNLSESKKRKEQAFKVSLILTSYLSLIIAIAISSILSGMAFPIFGFCFSQILINLFKIDSNTVEENFALMWFIIADAIILFIFLIGLNYFISRFFCTYTEEIRTESFPLWYITTPDFLINKETVLKCFLDY